MENTLKDALKIDIQCIDSQHSRFFELWDSYSKAELPGGEKEMHNIIEDLEKYLRSHFKYEEQLLKEANYEHIESHIQQHEFFIKQISEMKMDLDYMNPVLFGKITSFMKKWFMSHILKTDKLYQEIVSNYLKSKP